MARGELYMHQRRTLRHTHPTYISSICRIARDLRKTAADIRPGDRHLKHMRRRSRTRARPIHHARIARRVAIVSIMHFRFLPHHTHTTSAHIIANTVYIIERINYPRTMRVILCAAKCASPCCEASSSSRVIQANADDRDTAYVTIRVGCARATYIAKR